MSDTAAETFIILNDGYYYCRGIHITLTKPLTLLYKQLDSLNPPKSGQLFLDASILKARPLDNYTSSMHIYQEEALTVAHSIACSYPGETLTLLNLAKNGNTSLISNTTFYMSFLEAYELYDIRQKHKMSTHTSIVSKDVMVFRNPVTGELLAQPYRINVITTLPVDRALTAGINESVINDIMDDRVHIILALAAKHATQHLILGAWGCGSYKNDPWTIALIFRDLIRYDYAEGFKTISFAIPDVETYNIFNEVMHR